MRIITFIIEKYYFESVSIPDIDFVYFFLLFYFAFNKTSCSACLPLGGS
jgi:hypothetical protein